MSWGCSLSKHHRKAEICIFFNNTVYFRVGSPFVAPIRNCGASVNRCFRSCILLRRVSEDRQAAIRRGPPASRAPVESSVTGSDAPLAAGDVSFLPNPSPL